jgi:DICT domain-containing protein
MLRAVVADNQVWGLGSTDERALEDAAHEMMRLAQDPTVDPETAPEGEFTLHDITLDHAKRVANGDRAWRR